MDLTKINQALEKLAEEAKEAIRASLDEHGVNPYEYAKGKNTLKDSKLANEIEHKTSLELVQLLLKDYWVYVNNGTQYPDYPPPIQAILDWCVENGISTENGEAYAIREAIFKRGIQPRPFAPDAWRAIDMLYDNFAEEVNNIFAEEMDKLLGK